MNNNVAPNWWVLTATRTCILSFFRYVHHNCGQRVQSEWIIQIVSGNDGRRSKGRQRRRQMSNGAGTLVNTNHERLHKLEPARRRRRWWRCCCCWYCSADSNRDWSVYYKPETHDGVSSARRRTAGRTTSLGRPPAAGRRDRARLMHAPSVVNDASRTDNTDRQRCVGRVRRRATEEFTTCDAMISPCTAPQPKTSLYVPGCMGHNTLDLPARIRY